MTSVFIDGKEGTTGLRIYDRLSVREDIRLITLPEEERKNPAKRRDAINQSDITFLCLPDAAAIEAQEMVENPETILIDTSTAHRTTPGWAYGFPELSEEHFTNVRESMRIAVPGCHAGGFIALVYPLVKYGILPQSALLTSYSVTGYSGGGKKMIAEYENQERDILLNAPRQYGLTQLHKHLKEMKFITQLEEAPVFCPVVSDFYSGMVMTVPVFAKQLADGCGGKQIKELYQKQYDGGIVSYAEDLSESGFISGMGLTGKDTMKIGVCGNEERILLIAQYDNLGKGASGAAVECMNIKMGADPKKGLDL